MNLRPYRAVGQAVLIAVAILFLTGASAPVIPLAMVKTMLVFLAASVLAMGVGIKLMRRPSDAGRAKPSGPAVPVPFGQTPSLPTSVCSRCGRTCSGGTFCSGCGTPLSYSPDTESPPKRSSRGIWPEIFDSNSAREAAQNGMWGAFFCAGATGVLVYLTSNGVAPPIEGFSASAYADVILFALLGLGIRAMSRTASVAALALYACEQVWMFGRLHGSAPIPLPMAAGVVLCFLSSIRGTFAYHKYLEKQEAELQPSAAPPF